MIDEHRGAEATGPNPDYKGPPLKRWHTVEVVAAEGTEIGLVEDTDYGLLTAIVRRQGEPWPHGMEPKVGGINTIAPGHRVYCVRADEHGPDIAMWQRFASYCRSCALSGEHDPMDFETFVAREAPVVSSPAS